MNQINHILKNCHFFDEPDNYLHPKFIKMFINNIVDLNEHKDVEVEIYITSHNYYFISQLLINEKLDSNNLKISQCIFEDSKYKSKIMLNDIKELKDCCASRLLYDIYGIYTPDFLDYLIGVSGLGFDKSGSADDKICSNNPNFRIKDKNNNPMSVKNCNEENNCKYEHHSYVNLIRNYYHHPVDRKAIIDDYNEKFDPSGSSDNYFCFENLLKKAVNLLVDYLKENNQYNMINFKEEQENNIN